MHNRPHEPSKYNIEFESGKAIAIGDHATVNVFNTPLPPSFSRDELRAAFQHANAELRAWRNIIAGEHIERDEVNQIVDWVLTADSKERLGMLLDQPGAGKSVVMRDTLEKLEAANVPVIAIKADTLSGIKTRKELADRIGLPALIEDCVNTLSRDQTVVVLLDQLDALSLALSRDQATLDVMLATLYRLREMDGVRIIASSRAFDLKNDPRLSTIKIDREFQLQPLNDDQVNLVLKKIGVDPARLLPEHRKLLTIPLHLDVYSRVVGDNASPTSSESFRTLQELYEALWRKRIESVPPEIPSVTDRIGAINRLMQAMQARHLLIAPDSTLDDYRDAANYLERIGIIQKEKSNWLFSHQTFFDYCYARWFVGQGEKLSEEIFAGSQGLFERSQMVQVLAYLRGADETNYHRELNALLFGSRLRVHLRLLLMGWFASLPNPSGNELSIARKLIQDKDDLSFFLLAASGNLGWFDRLKETILPKLLQATGDSTLDLAMRYLGTLIQQRTDEVLAILRPYLGTSDAWDNRISYCLSRLDNWQNDEALNMLCDVYQRGRSEGWARFCLATLAKSNPDAGCQALRVYLDKRLDDLLAQTQNQKIDRFAVGRSLIGEHGVHEIMQAALVHCPEKIIEHLLPWFVRASITLSDDRVEDEYPMDSIFSWGWYGEHRSEGATFAALIARAMEHLAQTNPSSFRAKASELAMIGSLAVQRVLIHAYLSAPETYADEIFVYLTSDSRRLCVGEPTESRYYDSCRLLGTVFQHTTADRRLVLEDMILKIQPDWENRRVGLRGYTQLRFLKMIPEELLSDTGKGKLGELERKFPDFKFEKPQGVRSYTVGSPVSQEAQEKMSDDNWLSAMRKYNDSMDRFQPHWQPDKGGVVELSRALVEQVKKEPERFYRLTERFDETISLHYVGAIISGITESAAPGEWVFDLVRRFEPRLIVDIRRGVCSNLQKRAEAGVPDDLLDLMTNWALHDPDPVEDHGDNPLQEGINSNRGVAVEAVCGCALQTKPPQVERAFQLLEQAANDSTLAVRTIVIDRLLYMLDKDDQRAIAIFEQTLNGNPGLLQTRDAHEFLYQVYPRHFPRIRQYVEAILNDNNDETRQAGARLACLASFDFADAQDLALIALKGDAAMRQGAAKVHARNLGNDRVGEMCREPLLKLMHDVDEKVRAHVGVCFGHLKPEHLDELRAFINAFLDSPSLLAGDRYLIDFIKQVAIDEPALALQVTERILDIAATEVLDMRTARSMLEQDLARLPLTVYTHSDDPATKERAMNLFERLLLLGSSEARKALTDWDRR